MYTFAKDLEDGAVLIKDGQAVVVLQADGPHAQVDALVAHDAANPPGNAEAHSQQHHAHHVQH